MILNHNIGGRVRKNDFGKDAHPHIIYIERKEIHTMADIQNIPLNDIIQDRRVQDCIKRKASELARMNIKKYRNNQDQITSCHGWLICLHYTCINRLQGKYKISKPEFMVLMGSFLLMRLKNNGFTARYLSSTLLSWQYNRVYRHLHKLSIQGFLKIEKNSYSGLHRYWITEEGKRVIRAFSQHYWQVFDEVWGELGDLPNSFDPFP